MEDSVLAPDFGVLPLEGEDVPVLAPRLSELEPGIPTPQITGNAIGRTSHFSAAHASQVSVFLTLSHRP